MQEKISVGSSAFAWGPYLHRPVSLDTLAGRLQELGYDGIELFGDNPHASLERYPDTASRQGLRRMLQHHGLEVSGYGPVFPGATLAGPDAEERARYLALFDKNLQMAVDLGSPSIRVDTFHEPPLPASVSYDDAWSRCVEAFHSVSGRAAREGIRVVWEFEPGFMFNRPGEILRLVHDVDQPNFWVLYDTCHAHLCTTQGSRQSDPIERLPGGEEELARRLAGRLGLVHLIDSDNTLHDNMTSTHAPFGTGVIDFPRVVSAIREAGYDGRWWVVDLCFCAEAWEELGHSREVVAALIGRPAVTAASSGA